MFGEEKMFGKSQIAVDNKTRIILPKSTKREEGDSLALLEDREINIYRIYRAEEIEKTLDKLSEQINDSKTPEERKKYKQELCDLSKSILRISKVDKFGRIILGDSFKNVKTVNVFGARDHLLLELKK